ncbi:MAG: hypothetical protein WCY33_06145 [Clostridia bacterium]
MKDNLFYHPKPDYYHVSWLEIAVENFKNNKDIVHTIRSNMTMKEFIKKYAKNQLDKIVDI